MADRTSMTGDVLEPPVAQEQVKRDRPAVPPHWDRYIATGRRQIQMLAAGALAIVVGLLALAASGIVDLNLPLMLLLSATAGLSSMSAP